VNVYIKTLQLSIFFVQEVRHSACAQCRTTILTDLSRTWTQHNTKEMAVCSFIIINPCLFQDDVTLRVFGWILKHCAIATDGNQNLNPSVGMASFAANSKRPSTSCGASTLSSASSSLEKYWSIIA